MLQVIARQLKSNGSIFLMEYFSYNGEQYANHPNSVNSHYHTTLGDIDNKILAVGEYYTSISKNNKVELFDISSNTWSTKTSFLFCASE